MHILVLGAGSVGSLVGGLLADTHQVTLVGRAPHMRRVAADGLRITGTVERRVHPAAMTGIPDTDNVDVCVLTVKAFDTTAAAQALADSPPPTVISLQNGLDNEAILRTMLPDRTTILAGTTTYGALQEEPGTVICTGRGEIQVGAPSGGRSPIAERIAEAFTRAGVPTTARPDMPSRLWEKLAINAGINPTTALAGVTNGHIAKEPLRWIAQEAARETGRVARTYGINCDLEEVATEVVSVARHTGSNTSSMARDLSTGGPTEIDAINGAVINRARKIPVPINRTLYGLVTAHEEKLA